MLNSTSIYDQIQDELVAVEEKLGAIGRKSSVADPSLLVELLSHILEAPGKRTRPAITILASKFHPHDREIPLIMAAAVELLHIATLIHDDTVDNSHMRRGKATVSSKWGENVAVLLGDYVFATSATLVCDTNNVRVIRRFSETIMELSSGELSEISDAFKWDITMESYWQRIYEKTASLFLTSAESGAVLSGVSEDVVQSLKSYGYNLGMAFQIVDDILDFQGTEDEIGKPVGSDLLHGTITLPSILLIEKYPNENVVKRFFENPESEDALKRAIEMIQNSDIIPQSYSVASDLINKAIQSIKSLNESSYKKSLVELASYVMERRY